MLRRVTIVVCVFAFVALTAALASATSFNVANYTCTDLYGVARNFSVSDLQPNFRAYSLSDSGIISGEGDTAILTQGVPSINSRAALQCGPAGFGPMSFSGNSSVGFTSLNGNYTNQGIPTSGSYYNTGVAFNGDNLATFGGNNSHMLSFAGAGSNDNGGAYWTSGGGRVAPSALSTAYCTWANNNGLVAAGDYSSYAGTGNIGEVYDTVAHTSTSMPGAALFVNDGGQVCGTANGYGNGWVYNTGSDHTYWPAGSTTLSSMMASTEMSQNGRYVTGIGGNFSATTGVLLDGTTKTVIKSFSGEAYAVNNAGWFGGDTEADYYGSFSGTAWLWDGTTQHNLNTELQAKFPTMFSGMTVCAVWGINNSNQVLVWAQYNRDVGTFASYLLTPVPEPSTLLLLVSGTIGLVAYAWRKRK